MGVLIPSTRRRYFYGLRCLLGGDPCARHFDGYSSPGVLAGYTPSSLCCTTARADISKKGRVFLVNVAVVVSWSDKIDPCAGCVCHLVKQRQVEAENAASVLPTAGSVRSLDQLQGTLGGEQAGLSVALGKLIGGGVMEGGPAHGIAPQLAPPPPPPPPPPSKHQPKRSVNAQPTPVSRPSPGATKPT
ncbi:unnamed protein product [Mesocestoides corti]|uniref:Zf-LSD1 domain-containing protein n=1 Tax=Mesocestoides corti TaxID=53468 RepID=A0A0R3URD9_MESCO|nr:unnamed protein product [Mesocestoides corti]